MPWPHRVCAYCGSLCCTCFDDDEDYEPGGPGYDPDYEPDGTRARSHDEEE